MARCKFRSVFVAIRLYFEVECNIQPVLLSILYIYLHKPNAYQVPYKTAFSAPWYLEWRHWQTNL